MRLLTNFFAIVLTTSCTFAQTTTPPAATPIPVSPETNAAVTRLIGDVIVNGKAYDYDRHLADNIGPRLTGSDNYVHAVSWAAEHPRSSRRYRRQSKIC